MPGKFLLVSKTNRGNFYHDFRQHSSVNRIFSREKKALIWMYDVTSKPYTGKNL